MQLIGTTRNYAQHCRATACFGQSVMRDSVSNRDPIRLRTIIVTIVKYGQWMPHLINLVIVLAMVRSVVFR